jgi:hypothetical protein
MKQFEEEGEAADGPGGGGHAAPAGATANRQASAHRSGFRRFRDMLDSNFWLLSGMTLGITALITGWWVVSGQGSDGIRLFDKSAQASQHLPQTAQQSDTGGRPASDQLEDQLAGLVDRVNMLADSINYLESKLIRAHELTDSIITAEQRGSSAAPKQTVANEETIRRVNELPPSAAGQTANASELAELNGATAAKSAAASLQSKDRAVTKASSSGVHAHRSRGLSSALSTAAAAAPDTDASTGLRTNRDYATGTTTAAATAARTPAVKHLPATGTEQKQWVVNLTSSPSQADADRFAADVESKGVRTQLQEVTDKGKHYWRVQTTGFPTASEAQAYAGIVREKLGLQSVWIIRR